MYDEYVNLEDNQEVTLDSFRFQCIRCSTILCLCATGTAAVAASLPIGAVIGIMVAGIVSGAIAGYRMATCFWKGPQAAPAPIPDPVASRL
jgi:hypothetical protein